MLYKDSKSLSAGAWKILSIDLAINLKNSIVSLVSSNIIHLCFLSVATKTRHYQEKADIKKSYKITITFFYN